jgi:hypothetical protein
LRRKAEAAVIRERNCKIAEMFEKQKLPTSQICALMQVSRTVAYKALKEAGVIPPRPVGKAKVEPPRFRRQEPTETVERLMRLAGKRRAA